MAATPLKRIYFDTNILYKWPHLPNDVHSIFRSASWVGTELYLPSVVEDELESQYVRRVDEVFASIDTNLKQLDRLCRNVIALNFTRERPDRDALREAFRARTKQLQQQFNIASIPLARIPSEIYLDMAVNRVPPFEEYEVSGNKKQVVGLQDAAILFSVAEHMKTAAAGDRCALISADGVFQKPDISKLLAKDGITLEVFKSVRALMDDFHAHIKQALRAAWAKEIQQVQTSLNEQKGPLAELILPIFQSAPFGQHVWNSAMEILAFEVTDVSYVTTELPDANHWGVQEQAFTRPEGEPVSVSATVVTQLQALVKTLAWSPLIGALSGTPPPTGEAEIATTLQHNTFTPELNVSLTGIVHNGVIGDFQVTGVELVNPHARINE